MKIKLTSIAPKLRSFVAAFLISVLIFQIGLGAALPAIAGDGDNDDAVESSDTQSLIEQTTSENAVSPATMFDLNSLNTAAFQEYGQEFASDIEALQLQLSGKRDNNPLDPFGALQNKNLPYDADSDSAKPSAIQVNSDKIAIEVLSGDQVVRTIYPDGRSKPFVPGSANETYTFRLSYQGKPFNVWSQPIQSIAFLGKYVVFTEPGDFVPQHGSNPSYQVARFIDLDFFGSALGRTEIGKFGFGVQTPSESTALVASGDGLFVGGKLITQAVLEAYSDANQIAWNTMVNMLRADTYEEVAPLVDNSFEAMMRSMEMSANSLEKQGLIGGVARDVYANVWQDILNQVKAQKKTIIDDRKKRKEILEEGYSKLSQADEAELQEALKTGTYDESLEKNVDAFSMQVEALEALDKKMDLLGQIGKDQARAESINRKISTRFSMLWTRLSLPQPMGAPDIRTGLATIAGGIKTPNGPDLREGILQTINVPAVKYGASVAAAFALGMAYPHEASMFLYTGVDLGRTMVTGVLGTVKDVFFLGYEAVSKTIQGLNPMTFRDAYLSQETFPKFAEGLGAIMTTLGLIVGIPHVTLNTVALVKDMLGGGYREQRKLEVGRIKSVIKAVIARQNRLQTEYLDMLSDAEAKQSGNKDGVKFTPEQDQQVQEIIEKLEAQHKNGIFRRIGRAMKGSAPLKWVFRPKKNVKPSEEIVRARIVTLRQAITHVVFSWESFSRTATLLAKAWNGIFAVRSFSWYPKRWVLFLMYPSYFRRAADALTPTQQNLNKPTEANGAYLGAFTVWKRRLQKYAFRNSDIAKIEALEKKIIPVEEVIHKIALKQSFKASVGYAKTTDDLADLFKAGGVDSITDARIEKLGRRQRAFLRSYHEQLVDRATMAYLSDLAKTDAIALDGDADLSLLKRVLADADRTLSLTPDAAQTLVKELPADEIYAEAQRIADANLIAADNTDPLGWLQRQGVNWKNSVTTSLEPKRNRQMGRIMSVKRKLQDPLAKARAVRASVAKIVGDKPMELMLTFMLMAGMADGFFKPIQDERFSDNSWHYLSKAVFTNGFISAVIVGLMADTWMKLQMDEQSEGKFDKVPEGDDAKLSYLKWFRKQAAEPDLSLWKSQKFYCALIWANMPAALAMYLVTNLLTLGRFDIDMYAVGYVTAVASFLGGVEQKYDQAFDRSTGYVAKDFPKELRSHPQVMKYTSSRIGKMRIKFQLIYKLWENVTSTLVLNFSNMTSARYGSRALSRVLFKGYTLTELFNKAVDSALDLGLKHVPVVNTTLEWCEMLLGSNPDQFVKYIPKRMRRH